MMFKSTLHYILRLWRAIWTWLCFLSKMEMLMKICLQSILSPILTHSTRTKMIPGLGIFFFTVRYLSCSSQPYSVRFFSLVFVFGVPHKISTNSYFDRNFIYKICNITFLVGWHKYPHNGAGEHKREKKIHMEPGSINEGLHHHFVLLKVIIEILLSTGGDH